MEIFLDKKGFDEISNYITELRKSLNDIRKEKGHAYMEDSNTWHDNYAFEFANAREIDLLDQIENQLNTYNEAKLEVLYKIESGELIKMKHYGDTRTEHGDIIFNTI